MKKDKEEDLVGIDEIVDPVSLVLRMRNIERNGGDAIAAGRPSFTLMDVCAIWLIQQGLTHKEILKKYPFHADYGKRSMFRLKQRELIEWEPVEEKWIFTKRGRMIADHLVFGYPYTKLAQPVCWSDYKTTKTFEKMRKRFGDRKSDKRKSLD